MSGILCGRTFNNNNNRCPKRDTGKERLGLLEHTGSQFVLQCLHLDVQKLLPNAALLLPLLLKGSYCLPTSPLTCDQTISMFESRSDMVAYTSPRYPAALELNDLWLHCI